MARSAFAVLILCVFGGGLALAQSEFMHQADAGRFELSPSLSYASAVLKYKYDNSSQFTEKDETLSVLGVEFQYGLSNLLAIGVRFGYETDIANYKDNVFYPSFIPSSSSRASGVQDPDFELKGRMDTGNGLFRFGADLTLPIEQSRVAASGDSNVTSGRTTLTPFVGYEFALPHGFLGGRVSDDVYASDATRDNESAFTSQPGDHTLSGGQTLTVNVFGEGIISRLWTIGGLISYASVSATDDSYQGVKTEIDQEHTLMAFTVYAPLHVSPDVMVMPLLTYGTLTSGDSNSVSSYNYWGTGLKARFEF